MSERDETAVKAGKKAADTIGEVNETTVKAGKKAADMISEVRDKLVVRLEKPFEFEGETIAEADLRGLRDLSGRQLINMTNYLVRIGSPVSSRPEITVEFALLAAATVMGKPMEIMDRFGPRDVIHIKNRVSGFFYDVV